jgi:sugar/nucleoside kinase (ribokinase family)
MRTLIVGHVTHDHYEEGFVAGGCAYYGARVLSRLSGSFHLLTAVGEDFVCDDALEGIDATVHRGGRTTVFANYYPDDGPRIQLLDAVGMTLEPAMAPQGWLEADLIHLAPVIGEMDLQAWKGAKKGGLLAINVQGWIKRAGPLFDASLLEQTQRRGVTGTTHRVVQQPWTITREELSGVDIACLSEEDLIGQGDLLERLIDAVPIVALTFGARGSRVYVNGQPSDVGIEPAHVVDPTGAGDVYAATFAHGIATGRDPIEAARQAAKMAAVVISDIGARAL